MYIIIVDNTYIHYDYDVCMCVCVCVLLLMLQSKYTKNSFVASIMRMKENSL